MRNRPPAPHGSGLLVRAFLIDPLKPQRTSGGTIAHSSQAIELLEQVRRSPEPKLGSVLVHPSQQCAGLLCLNGVRSLEFFEGSLDQFQNMVSELFPLNTEGVLVEVPAVGTDPNLPYDEVLRIARKYFLCDKMGRPTNPLFQLVQVPKRSS